MRFTLLLVATLLFVALIDMPRQFTLGGHTFYRPRIAFNLLGKPFYRSLDFRLGLDLQGGSHIVYQADVTTIPDSDRSAAIDSTRTNIERRINLLGVAESIVQTSQVGDEYRLIVEMPGITDVQQAITTIGATAQLDFRELASPSAASSEAAYLRDYAPTGLTGKDLKLAQVQFGGGSKTVSQEPVVSLEFNSEGAQMFSAITKRNIGNPVAIYLDDAMIMNPPTVQTEITDGKAIISGGFTVDQAKQLAIQLNAGALPVPIKIIEQRNIGATLGSESVAKSLFAGLVGLVIIWVFMIVNYGFKGFLANVALTVYVLLSLAVFKLIPVTLTLAGIAGFILSVGMAVDANILIFERIKEELRWGRPKAAALELGFHRAWTSVRDSNASSIITATILFWFGSGPVRGFALTLLVGIIVSLFTSINVTRGLLRVFNK